MYNSIQDTLIIGKKVIYLPTCHSTNDIAAEIVHAGLFDEGTIVITDNQVKGRGQRGTEWVANPGQNLTFSVILTPVFLPVADQFLLSQIVALAIRAYVNKYVPDVKVKWPNDIHANGKKVCGVLIENAIQGSKISTSIIGIGINVNQQSFTNAQATSIGKETGEQYTLGEEFHKVLRCLDMFYADLKLKISHDRIRTDYLSNLYGYNQSITFRHQNRILTGTVDKVTQQGKLIMQLLSETGTIEVGLKEIEWLN
ncbi:biotin--[acetyl-CoA-carboxylase] ligase [Dyadobacter chenwenxiniae]|uniref:Biotin--[acetyl-CoA-carboxylase] ligase n=1 Tax=Dyadobacter chenwenxiniae TaxID=2906456 RepID=A0A9X1TDY1_9BACT|nr:biotin--[acetyl-CoA-carboxylase] ligase [Dyadobacter chenwenxiniae]MCF0060850.1 biotin--[acetyl-CoA-carboxylase] ligase [Dyadobacter chenwenxiniae]UON80678.1 biotin--[acetyl-CoA-carboxylase] ligase [Dyadobacter chenwenxiniae]